MPHKTDIALLAVWANTPNCETIMSMISHIVSQLFYIRSHRNRTRSVETLAVQQLQAHFQQRNQLSVMVDLQPACLGIRIHSENNASVKRIL